MKQEILKMPGVFWIAVGGMILTFAVALSVLQVQHIAFANEAQDKGAALRTDFETDSQKLDEIYASVIKIETNQELIMQAFNLVPVK